MLLHLELGPTLTLTPETWVTYGSDQKVEDRDFRYTTHTNTTYSQHIYISELTKETSIDMLSRRDLISSPAHEAIADGDDLLMTPSFDADEENSSVVANASCRTRSTVVGMSDPTKATKKSITDENEGDRQLSNRSLKVKKLLKRVRKLPRAIRQNSFLFGSSTNTVAEYEEMFEDGFGLEEEERFANADAETIASLRSSRNNVRTGMSMLIRQQGIVMNRPSLAYANKNFNNREVLHAPSPDRKNFRNAMLLRGKSLILDDCSIGGMSDITEDASAVYAYPNTDHLAFRRTPMFINANTYCINEDEDESESDSDEPDSISVEQNATIDRAYDFRELSPLNDGVKSVDDDSCISDVTETRSNAYSRMHTPRIDIVASDTQLSNLSSLTTSIAPQNENETIKSTPKHPNDSIPNNVTPKGADRTVGATPLRKHAPAAKPAPYAAWPFPKTRTYSDLYVPDDKANHSKIKKSIRALTGISRNRSSSHEILISDTILTTRQSSRRQSLPLLQKNEQSPTTELRTRTFSDSIVNDRLAQEEILWDPRNVSLLDTESMAMKEKLNQSPTRSKILGKEKKTLLPETPHTTSSSVLATLSNTNIQTPEKFAEPKKHQSQRPLVASVSPRTLTAASKIAAALRPGPARHGVAVPSSRQSADQYYWGKTNDTADDNVDPELELKNLCSWSSDSFDDIL